MALSSKKKVLITGINGFTGVHLENYLSLQGYEVYGTVVDVPQKKNHLRCDITKLQEVEDVISAVKPQYLIHTAAISFVGEGNASLIYNVNVIGTENILQTLVNQNYKVDKVILASSATIYGNQNKEMLDESMCPKPVNHYGVSKLAMECIAKNYFDKLNIIITRPFNYTGIGQADYFLIPKIVQHFKEKKPFIELGNLNVSREFNDIDFVCEIYQKLMESNVTAEVFNLCSSRGVKLLDVLKMMKEISGHNMEVKVNPDFVRKNEIKKLIGSPDKLFSAIGVAKQKSFKDTLREMYEA